MERRVSDVSNLRLREMAKSDTRKHVVLERTHNGQLDISSGQRLRAGLGSSGGGSFVALPQRTLAGARGSSKSDSRLEFLWAMGG
jgi:hypothetical protein